MTTVSLSIIHAAHMPERQRSLDRLLSQLAPSPPWLLATLIHRERELPRDPKTGFGWASRAWAAASRGPASGAEFHLFLNDDVLPSPTFWTSLQAILRWLPQNAALGLGTVDPIQRIERDAGKRYCHPGIVGWGYGLWHHHIRKVSSTEMDLPDDHRSPHSHDECPADCHWWHEDAWLTEFLHDENVEIWHPIPSILDHDTTVLSAYDNDHHKNRTAQVHWRDYSESDLTSLEFWKP